MKYRLKYKYTIPVIGRKGWRYVRGKYPPLLPPQTFDSEADAQDYIDRHASTAVQYRIVPEPKPRLRKPRRFW